MENSPSCIESQPDTTSFTKLEVEGAADQSNGRTVTANRPKDWCPLFDLLNFDLRWQIYQHAFAGRVVHLYLLYTRTLKSDSRWRKAHQPVVSWYPHSPGGLSTLDLLSGDPDASAEQEQSRRWHWWGCVCRLDDEICVAPRRRGMEMGLPDPCPQGVFFLRSGSDQRDATCLGVMGWLTSCRQAYEETIQLLYSSTTFKLEQRLQALYFPQMLPQPQRSWLTSLDIRITDYDDSLHEANMVGATVPTPTSQSTIELNALGGREQYRRILASAAASFPGLRRLHLTFEGSVRPSPAGDSDDSSHSTTGRLATTTLGEMEADELEPAVLGPLDALPASVQRRVVFFRSVYDALLQAARQKQPVDEEQTCGGGPGSSRAGWTRFWRRLDQKECERGGYWIYLHR
ncbi:hypothetical protein SODALDRAFT_351292 [Sodiomyces alkalinus F11]|uniref:DUF7730 domain-containing protein n=1 Tax=Sodiomyces alkalinus (strain CBS 110278 / VKM F-3762 / F11) TaxID=1314773 RepID=A0A3N2PUJ5_SODAK|nr:hypothetical protein SODALDRAFT_351292 [Sodiomyces alkalinus F11]ROT38167.1 hypothetical protein SODALDRAFT_351292 [Sodiomyces alkalinus F11]